MENRKWKVMGNKRRWGQEDGEEQEVDGAGSDEEQEED